MGFDFLSSSGEGAEAKPIINEVKDHDGEVPTDSFSSFGLGAKARGTGASKGMATLNQSIQFAENAIKNADIDNATKAELLLRLRNRTAQVRILGDANTVVSDSTRQAITAKSSFQVRPGIVVVPLP